MMKKILIALLVIPLFFAVASCSSDNDSSSAQEYYSYTEVGNVSNRKCFTAKVTAIHDNEVELSFDVNENKEAIKSFDEEEDKTILFQADRTWIDAKDWPVPLHVGDDIYFSIIGYGVLQNSKSPVLVFPPVKFHIEHTADIATPIYSYTKIEVDAEFTAKVLGFFESPYLKEEVRIYIKRDWNVDAIEKISAKYPHIAIIFQPHIINVIRAKDWPVPLKEGDVIKFKITGYGIQQNYAGIFFDLPPVMFDIDPIIEENS